MGRHSREESAPDRQHSRLPASRHAALSPDPRGRPTTTEQERTRIRSDLSPPSAGQTAYKAIRCGPQPMRTVNGLRQPGKGPVLPVSAESPPHIHNPWAERRNARAARRQRALPYPGRGTPLPPGSRRERREEGRDRGRPRRAKEHRIASRATGEATRAASEDPRLSGGAAGVVTRRCNSHTPSPASKFTSPTRPSMPRSIAHCQVLCRKFDLRRIQLREVVRRRFSWEREPE